MARWNADRLATAIGAAATAVAEKVEGLWAKVKAKGRKGDKGKNTPIRKTHWQDWAEKEAFGRFL